MHFEKHSNVKSNIFYILRQFTVWLNAFLYLKNHLEILDFRRGKRSAHGDGARDVTMGKIGRKLLPFYTTSTKTFWKAGETVFLFLFEDKRWPKSDCQCDTLNILSFDNLIQGAQYLIE